MRYKASSILQTTTAKAHLQLCKWSSDEPRACRWARARGPAPDGILRMAQQSSAVLHGGAFGPERYWPVLARIGALARKAGRPRSAGRLPAALQASTSQVTACTLQILLPETGFHRHLRWWPVKFYCAKFQPGHIEQLCCGGDTNQRTWRHERELMGMHACCRADNIVRDSEVIRSVLLGPESHWSILGQSFGGFCCMRYLSAAPTSKKSNSMPQSSS